MINELYQKSFPTSYHLESALSLFKLDQLWLRVAVQMPVDLGVYPAKLAPEDSTH